MHFTLGKGESVAVEREQPNVKRETLARQVCQTLGKGESNGSKLGNSAIGEQLLSQPYLIRKNGFRKLNRRSIRFKPPTGSCKLSRGTFRVRMLNRCGTIRFRTHCHPNVTVRKKQQQLLRSGKTGLKEPLNTGTSRVRMLNRCGPIPFKVAKPYVQSDRVHNHSQCGKSELFEKCTSGDVRDCTRYIQAVTLHHHQSDWSQKIVENKEGLLRNNYDQDWWSRS